MVEEIDISPEDTAEALKLLKEIPNIASSVSVVIQNVISKVQNNEFKTTKGLSFLDLKNLNLLNYISNLGYIILRKLNGKKIESDPAVNRLAELRVVIEKMRPIDEKLKYQINKLLASVTSENIDTKDPLKFRANPESLEAEDEYDGTEVEQKEQKVYVPPKISASYFGEGAVEQKKKALEQAQKRALTSTMLQELKKEYDTGPEEIRETQDMYKMKLSDDLRKRERYEEEFMLRLPTTKKQRHEMRQLTTVTNFDPMFDEDASAVELTPNSMNSKKKSKGKKNKFKGKWKKKGSKRKH